MSLFLGRRFATRAPLHIARYLGSALPSAPSACGWTQALKSIGMMGNNALGDCTCAAMGHAVQTITTYARGVELTPPDSEIITMYEASGYTPGDPSTDQGWTELAAMQYMRDTGLSGVKAQAFADADYTNLVQIRQIIYLFGGCYIGVLLTRKDMDDFQAGRPWTDTGTDYIGGHALWVPAYVPDYFFPITWGKVQAASLDWYRAKCDEAHAIIFPAWINPKTNLSPDGFDLATLMKDLRYV